MTYSTYQTAHRTRPSSDASKRPRFEQTLAHLALVATIALVLPFGTASAQQDRNVTFDMLDVDADGRLSAMELRRTPLANQVSLFDVDGDGALSRAELGIGRTADDDPIRP